MCAQCLGAVASPVLAVWEQHVADPLIGEDALGVLSALAHHSACLVPLASTLRGLHVSVCVCVCV